MDSEKQMCLWMRKTKILQSKFDGEIPVTMSINTFKYFQMH
jgi:hypothetical protein